MRRCNGTHCARRLNGMTRRDGICPDCGFDFDGSPREEAESPDVMLDSIHDRFSGLELKAGEQVKVDPVRDQVISGDAPGHQPGKKTRGSDPRLHIRRYV